MRQEYPDGRYIGDGRLLAADPVNEGVLHRAVYYDQAMARSQATSLPTGRASVDGFYAHRSTSLVSLELHPEKATPDPEYHPSAQGCRLSEPTGTVIKAAGEGREPLSGRRAATEKWWFSDAAVGSRRSIGACRALPRRCATDSACGRATRSAASPAPARQQVRAYTASVA